MGMGTMEGGGDMSHSTNVYSPVGTPLIDQTVGEIVARSPLQARVFQAFGIDFCCQGGKTLREACERKGMAVETVVEQLEAGDRVGCDGNPADLPPADLVRHIVDEHHAYMRSELPRVREMAARVARVHGGHTPSLIALNEVFLEMEAEIEGHLAKEEEVLFPEILALCAGGPGVMPLDGPVACMMREHDDAGDALRRMRELSNGFVPPAEACNTYRALFAALEAMETDLHRHIHLENSVLFPQAMEMSRKAAR